MIHLRFRKNPDGTIEPVYWNIYINEPSPNAQPMNWYGIDGFAEMYSKNGSPPIELIWFPNKLRRIHQVDITGYYHYASSAGVNVDVPGLFMKNLRLTFGSMYTLITKSGLTSSQMIDFTIRKKGTYIYLEPN